MLHGLLLLVMCLNVKAAYDGDSCIGNGVVGICAPVRNCLSALQSIARRKQPQICSFADPIVCCFDHMASDLMANTNRSISQDSHYYGINESKKKKGECAPVDPQLTSPKTGQKAWDKCVEYQEKLVYPCKKSPALIGGYQRNLECHHNADELIVGGVNATRNEFPHMVLLGFETGTRISWECGGSLISESFILTAGHCVKHIDFGDVKYASLGVLARREVTSANTYKVKRSVRHPQYRIGVYNDIALIELEKQVELDAFTVPACLHVGDQIDDKRALATGWGLLEDHGTIPSDVLQKVIVKKIRTARCQIEYPKHSTIITRQFDIKTQLCYGDMNRKMGTCHGDSGGPLQIKHKKINCMYLLIGVTSGGKGCALRHTPELYTKVSHYLDWIESVVWPS